MDAYEPARSRPLLRGIGVGTATGLAFAGLGFLMLHFGLENLGAGLFIALPFFTGCMIALTTRGADAAIAALLLTTVLSLSFLAFTGFEGIICCVMAFPLLVAAMLTGVGAGLLLKLALPSSRLAQRSNSVLVLTVSPLVLFGVDSAERTWTDDEQPVSVVTRHFLPVPPQQAWELIEQVDQLSAPKPLLLRLGLPVPTHCVLESGGLGGRRVCYFQQGRIEETITRWNPPHVFEMDITRATLPGRAWLDFVGARYEFEPAEGGTWVERSSTVSSRLAPRWYWESFEQMGVRAEHQYLFDSLELQIEEQSAPPPPDERVGENP